VNSGTDGLDMKAGCSLGEGVGVGIGVGVGVGEGTLF